MLTFREPAKANFQHKLRSLRRFIILTVIACGTILGVTLALVPIDESVRARGVVQAETDTVVYSPLAGTVGRIFVTEGARVERGDPLIELDTTELSQQLRQAEASVTRAREALEAEVAAFERARQLPLPSQFWHVQEELSIVRERVRQSAVELERAQNMRAAGLLSLQDVERAQLALNINLSEEDKVEDKLRLIEGGIEDKVLGELTARVQKARADIRALEVNRDITAETIERCMIRAAEAGTVTLLIRRRSGQPVEKGEALLGVAETNAVAPLLFTQELLPVLAAAKDARVVAISSWFASIEECGTRDFNFGYSGSKALLNCYFRIAANALRPHGVVAFMVNPGWMRTRMGGQRAERDPADSAREILDLARLPGETLAGRFVDTDGQDHPW